MSPQHMASGLGVLLVAGLIPGAAPRRRTGEQPGAAAAVPCVAEGGTGGVQAPKLVRQIDTGETGWFSSPGLVDLDGDGRKEIVAPFYSTFVFDANGKELGRGRASKGGSMPRRWSPISRATA